METEELIRKCKAINLEEGMKSRVAIGDIMKGKGKKLVAGCLLGKVLHPRGVNRDGLKSVLQQIWRTAEEVKIESLGSKMFMFKFASEADKRRVLAGGPWHFKRALIILKEPSGIGEITKQTFTHSTFWVQFHNVPIGCIEQDTVRNLGEAIGVVEEVDADEEGECIGQYARARISIDITQPLQKIIYLQQEGGDDIPILVVYERLPEFCFCCGIIGHPYKECDGYKGQPRDKLAYGVWMQAVHLFGKFKENKERGHKVNGKATNQSTKAKYQDHSGNSSPQQQQLSQWHRDNTNRAEPSSAKEDTHVAVIQGNNVEEACEAQLMLSLQDPKRQMIDCNKQSVVAENGKPP